MSVLPLKGVAAYENLGDDSETWTPSPLKLRSQTVYLPLDLRSGLILSP